MLGLGLNTTFDRVIEGLSSAMRAVLGPGFDPCCTRSLTGSSRVFLGTLCPAGSLPVVPTTIAFMAASMSCAPLTSAGFGSLICHSVKKHNIF